jgi:replicative DNA helicase
VNDYERVPPQDPNAEMAVLGGVLLSKAALEEVTEILDDGSDFYLPKHQNLYEAALAVYGRSEPADAVTVAREMDRRGELVRAGGPGYLHELMESVPNAASAGYYAEIVHEKAVLRRVIQAGTRVAQMGYETDIDDVGEIVDRAQAEVFALSRDRDKQPESSNSDELDAMLEEIEHPTAEGMLTGLADLDALTHGLHSGQMIVVAARPALGKSTLSTDWHRQASVKRGEHSILFSLEMGKREILKRILSAEARIPLHHLSGGQMAERDWDRVNEHRGRIDSAPLHIIDDAYTLNDIRVRARSIARKHPVKLITVDYLQLISGASSKRNGTRQEEVSETSRSLKLLAKELGVPIVAVAQLNRGPEQRTDKKPVMSDLRESGSLEQDADVVILIHREDAHEKEGPRSGEADLIVAKHRNGPTAIVAVAFQGHYARFVDLARQWSPHDAAR